MVAGGLTFAISGVTSDAKAEAVSDQFVYASSDRFGGPMVLEILVTDPNLRSVSDPESEPAVTFGGHELRMVQGVDGNWYAYVGHTGNIAAIDAASITMSEGLDFGTECTLDEANNLVSDNFAAGATVFVNNANCPTGRPDTNVNVDDVMNIIRNDKSPSNNGGDDLDATPSRGQVGLLDHYWPFIQTFDFSDDVQLPLVYTGNSVYRINVIFDDDMDDYAEFTLDNDIYPYNTNVLLTINDNQLNIDPTDEDVWTFLTTPDGDSYYHLFDDRGRINSNNPVNYRHALSNAGVDSNLGFLTITDSENILKFRDNHIHDFANNVVNNPVGVRYLSGAPLVTMLETGSNSGMFTNDDSSFMTNMYTTDDESLVDSSFEVDYNDSNISSSLNPSPASDTIPGQVILDAPSTGEFYTWTDIVGITVVAADNNSDSGVREDIMVEVFTDRGRIDNYVLKETDTDTGNFTGMVTLTGFEHDADGDGTYDAPTRNGTAGGTGPTDGFLQADGDDSITVFFDYSGEDLENYTGIKWNTGTVAWDRSNYTSTETATFSITDPDMNLNPDVTDTFKVNVTSSTDVAGIALDVTETGIITGIFEGTVDFTDTGSSSGNKLLISANDTITGNYMDRTTREAPAAQSMNATASINLAEPVVQRPTELAIILNKENYTWTDRVKITVTVPDGNIATGEILVNASTSMGYIEQYKLTESGANTGNFTGAITLAGFEHDADGDRDNDAPTKADASGGTGPTGGYLQAKNVDTIYVSFINNGNNITASAPIGWTLGTAKWLDANYTVFGSGIFEIVDPDLNLKPDTVDEFKVNFYSSSNSYSRPLNVKETGESTGIFQVTVPFTLETSSNKLTVVSNATITGRYDDHTLPVPAGINNQKTLNVTNIIEIYTETNSTETNSTDTETNSTDTKPEEKKPAEPKTTKPADKPAKPAEPKQKAAEPKKTTPEPQNEPEPEPAAPVVAAPIPTPAVPEPDPEPGVDPEPGFDPPAEPTCGPGTELVGGVCQAIEVQPENFDIIDWLFSLFQR